MWFGPIKNRTLTSLQDLECTFGGRGVSQMVSGSATLADHAVATRDNRTKKSSLGVLLNHPSFPPRHMGWLNRFRVFSPKACITLSVF
jgi:hypothetical protein